MINLDGATLLFPTSFGYFDPHILKDGGEVSRSVRFAHCGGLWTEGKHPKNVGSYFGYIDEASTSPASSPATPPRANKLGFIAAKPIPQVLRNINAFTLGAQLGQPEGHHAGDLHRRLVDAGQGGRGGQQPDRPGRRRRSPATSTARRSMVETAERARHLSSAATTPTRPTLAPKGYLTGAEWNWASALHRHSSR